MNYLVILLSVVAMVASAPTETKNTAINVDGPDGQHVQTGEPGKAVSEHVTSRSADGAEDKTTHEVDEKSLRARGMRLPVYPAVTSARLPATYPVRYPTSAYPNYDYRYGPQNYLPFFYPTYPQDKYMAGEDSLSTDGIAYKQAGDDFPFTEQEQFALAQSDQVPFTDAEITALAERGMLTPMLLPFIIMNKKNMLIMMLVNKMLMAMG